MSTDERRTTEDRSIDPAAYLLRSYIRSVRVDFAGLKAWERQFLTGYIVHAESLPCRPPTRPEPQSVQRSEGRLRDD